MLLCRYVNQVSKKKSDPSTRRQEYTRVCSAMKRLGFPQEAVTTVWSVLAAILNLGNLEFEAGENEGTEISNQAVLARVAELLDAASVEELAESLTGRVIAAHGEVVRKLHNKEDALRARDAFAKVSDDDGGGDNTSLMPDPSPFTSFYRYATLPLPPPHRHTQYICENCYQRKILQNLDHERATV